MASEKEVTTGFAVTGSLTAAALILSIAAIALGVVDRQNLENENNRITDLESKVPILVNDGENVAGSVSIVGDPGVTDGLTILPKYHFKGLIAGPGIDIEPDDDVVTVSYIGEVILETAPATEADPVSLVATSSTANFPITRNLIAGSGVTLTLSGDDIIISI